MGVLRSSSRVENSSFSSFIGIRLSASVSMNGVTDSADAGDEVDASAADDEDAVAADEADAGLAAELSCNSSPAASAPRLDAGSAAAASDDSVSVRSPCEYRATRTP